MTHERIREAERAFLLDPFDDEVREAYVRELDRRGIDLEAVVLEALKKYGRLSDPVFALTGPFEDRVLDAIEKAGDRGLMPDGAPGLLGELGFAVREREALVALVDGHGRDVPSQQQEIERRWDRVETLKFDEGTPVEDPVSGDVVEESTVTHFTLFRTDFGFGAKVAVRAILYGRRGDIDESRWVSITYYRRRRFT